MSQKSNQLEHCHTNKGEEIMEFYSVIITAMFDVKYTTKALFTRKTTEATYPLRFMKSFSSKHSIEDIKLLLKASIDKSMERLVATQDQEGILRTISPYRWDETTDVVSIKYKSSNILEPTKLSAQQTFDRFTITDIIQALGGREVGLDDD